MNSINLNKLGIFGTIATQQGDHGRTTLRLVSGLDGFDYKAGGVYDATKLGERWFRSEADKTANNAIRTKLLEHLAATFGLEGVQRDKSTGAVTFSKELLDALEKSLGKDVLLRGDFGIGKDGKVGSGSPLTERRITAIVNRVHDLCVPAARKRLELVHGILESHMTQSLIAFDGKGDHLSMADTAKVIRLFQQSGCRMETVDTVGKLKGLIEKATGRACRIVSPHPDPAYLEAPIFNPGGFKNLFVDKIAHSDELQKAAETVIAAQKEGRRGLSKTSTIRQLPTWTEQVEAFDFSRADHVVGKDNLAEIRKNPVGKGVIVAHYPDEVASVDACLKKAYAGSKEGERTHERFDLFFDRKFVFEIDGKEMSGLTAEKADFLRQLDDFFGEDERMESAINTLFGRQLSLPPLHDERAKDVMSLMASADDGPRVLQKFSLSRNDDGSFRITCKFCVMDPRKVMSCKPARIPGKDGNSIEQNIPISLRLSEDGPAPQNSYVSYQLCFDVVQGANGPEAKGVGEHPASMKFRLDEGYEPDPNFVPEGAEFI